MNTTVGQQARSYLHRTSVQYLASQLTIAFGLMSMIRSILFGITGLVWVLMFSLFDPLCFETPMERDWDPD